jgi:hypothetical protein
MHHHGRCGRKATKEHGDHRKARQNISPLDLAIPGTVVGRRPFDAGRPLQLDRIRSYSDYLLLRMANFTTRSEAQLKNTIGWQERAS